MTTTLQAFLDIAEAEIGYVEGPKENETKYGKAMRANFQPWCGSFVNWVAKKAGVSIPNCVYTPAGANAFIKSKAWEYADSADPKPGDIAFFDFPNDGIDRISHVGIVVSNNGDGTVTVIEGNTSPDAKGDQRNGGEVCKKIRGYKKKNRRKTQRSLPVAIVGFGRPKFKKLK